MTILLPQHFSPKIKEVFKLGSTFKQDISLSLLDEKDNVIRFAPGAPSIARVSILEKYNHPPMDTFHVQVSSNDSRDVYPDNTSHNFKSVLPQMLELNDSWKVALSKLFIPRGILNLCPPFDYITVLEAQTIHGQDVFERRTVKLEHNTFSSVTSLLTSLNSPVEKLSLSFVLREDRVVLIAKPRRKSSMLSVSMHPKLACTLGYEKSELSERVKSSSEVTLNIVPLQSLNGGKKQTGYRFEMYPDLWHTVPAFIFLYSNIVAKTMVSNKSIPLLKIIPPPSGRESVLHQSGFYEFENLEFFDINYNSIQTI